MLKQAVAAATLAIIVGTGFMPNSASAMIGTSSTTTRGRSVYMHQKNAQMALQEGLERKFQNGLQAYRNGNYAECIRNLSNNYVAGKYQRRVDYNVAIGDSYYHLKQYPQATPYLKRAYNTGASTSPVVSEGLGMSFYHMNLYEPAIPFLKKAAQTNRVTGEMLWSLSDAYAKSGHKEDMVETLRLLINKFPKYNKDAYKEVASSDLEKGNIQQGLAISMQGLKFFPNDGDLLYWAGHAYFLTQTYAKAMPYLEQSDKVMPNNIDTLYDLGMSYLQHERLDEASGCLDRMAAVNPNHPKTQELSKAVNEKIMQRQLQQQMQMDMANQAMQDTQDAANIGVEQANAASQMIQ